MKSKRPPASEAPAKKQRKKSKQKRKLRARPTPKWIESEEMEEMAQRRCLMILSVLSGEKAVTEAIREADITRPHYYQLERRALEAMLEALMPNPPGRQKTSSSQIREMEEKIQQLEKEKRRTERLLLLTRKALKPGPMKTTRGRPRKKLSNSSPAMETSSTSIPMKAGETTQ